MAQTISVIIPVYNRENVIEECVRSVCTQSHKELEIILIDDGSTDKTVEICRNLAAQDSRILLLEPGHTGVSGARNVGLDAATGEYVFFVDSDDVIHPRLLEVLVRGMEETKAGLGGTGIISVPDAHWDRVYPHMKKETGDGEFTFLNHEDTLNAIFRSIAPINLIGGVIMRRDLIGQTRFRTELFIGEDFWFIYQNLIKGTGAVFLKEGWYYCRHHETNISNNFTFAGFWTRFYRRELVWKSEESFGRTENVNLQKQDAFDVYLRCLRENITSTDRKNIRRKVKQYKKELLPAMDFAGKVRYYLYTYLPSTYLLRIKLQFLLKK
jgi:glycosyltransferase involved in cell wall biosynthesis